MSLVTFAPPSLAQGCDYTSYFQTKKGRCMDLTALSWLSRAQARQADLIDEAIPYEFAILSLNPAFVPGGVSRGQVKLTNVSQFTTMKTGWASISAPNGSVWRPFVEIDLPPGGVHVEDIFFDADPGSLTVAGPFLAEYNPEVERDLAGVSGLFDDRDNSLKQAWPYPSRELTVCLVDDRRCPSLMWQASGGSFLPKTSSGSSQASNGAGDEGKCDRPNDRASDGSRCGKRAASEKSGGR